MIRYNFHRDESGAYMVEDADGEYVLYAEVHPLVDGDLATQRAICDGLPGPNVPQPVTDEEVHETVGKIFASVDPHPIVRELLRARLK